jgi:flagellar hook-associated protein 3 FlgL
MTRIANLAQYNQMMANIRQTQTRWQDTNIQASTGYKAQRYSGIAPDSRQLINLESSRARMGQYQTNNNTVNLRLQTMEVSISNVTDAATKLKNLLTNALNGQNATELAIGQEAQNLLNEVAKNLNAKIGDRYLFSGTKTNVPPVDLNAPGFSAPPTTYPSVADTGYYQGDSTVLTTRAADDFDITYGVTANENGFEQVIRALNLTATVTLTPTVDRDRLQNALELVNQAVNSLPTIRSRVGSAQNALDQANEEHGDMTTFLDQSITNITGVDVAEAMSRMAADETLLNVSYMAIAKLGQLSLVNFMR